MDSWTAEIKNYFFREHQEGLYTCRHRAGVTRNTLTYAYLLLVQWRRFARAAVVHPLRLEISTLSCWQSTRKHFYLHVHFYRRIHARS